MNTPGVKGSPPPVTQGSSSSSAASPPVKKVKDGRVFSLGFKETLSEINLKKAFNSAKDFLKKIENPIPFFFTTKKSPPKEHEPATSATCAIFAEIKQEGPENFEDIPPLEPVEDDETVESPKEKITDSQTSKLDETRPEAGQELKDVNLKTSSNTLRKRLKGAQKKKAETKNSNPRTTRRFIEGLTGNTTFGDARAAELRESLKFYVGRGEYGVVANSSNDTVTLTFLERNNPVEAFIGVTKKGLELKNQTGEVIATASDFNELLKKLNLSERIDNSILP